MRDIARLIRTTRHLKFSQVSWRLHYRLKRFLLAKRSHNAERRIQRSVSDVDFADSPVATPYDLTANDSHDDFLSALRKGELCQLNKSRPFPAGPDWLFIPHQDRLWWFTAHYHEWLLRLAHAYNATRDNEYAAAIVQRLTDWLDHCRLSEPQSIQFGWNSYAIATRLDNWRQTLSVLPSSFWCERDGLRARLLQSMAVQAEFLYRNVEWDLRANHVMRNALGLACAGRALRGNQPRLWLQRAMKIADQQIEEQILADGGHFERSPMYHQEVLRDLLKISALLNDVELTSKIRSAAQEMATYLEWMRHPDGSLVQFNDAAARQAEVLPSDVGDKSLSNLSAHVSGRWWRETGVVAWHGNPWTVFFDMGEVGPDYQPGHAHADTLTIECSYAGRRLFVDPGCYGYDDDERRRYDRSTVAHNTVCIDGVNSSEVWHIFRVGRRARPVETDVQIREGALRAAAAHTGYDHLPGSPRHRRQVAIHDHGSLEIVDEITGCGDHHVEGGLLLDPQWTADARTDGWLLTCGNTSLRIRLDASHEVDLDVRPAVIHPDYGIELPTQRLAWSFRGELPLRVRLRIPSTTPPIPKKSNTKLAAIEFTAPV